MRYLGRTVGRSLPVLVAFTVAVGFAYGTGHAIYRSMAFDTPVQLARDAADRLGDGVSPEAIVSDPRPYEPGSLAPFVVIYDAEQTPVAWSMRIYGEPPAPPHGVLEAAGLEDNRVVWQPEPTFRFATVSVAAGGYTVMAGRGLDECDARISSLQGLALTAWLLGVIGILGAAYFVESRAHELDERLTGLLTEAPDEDVDASDLRSFTHH